jgi:hypothetical protein
MPILGHSKKSRTRTKVVALAAVTNTALQSIEATLRAGTGEVSGLFSSWILL